MSQEFNKSLAEISEMYLAWEEEFQQKVESCWESLDKEKQLLLFCAVVKRIHQGELVEHGSYRHVLYHNFKFGPEAYTAAQSSGYLELHNSIYSDAELKDKLSE